MSARPKAPGTTGCPTFTWGVFAGGRAGAWGYSRGRFWGLGRAVFWGTAGLAWSGFRRTDGDGRCQPLLAPGQAKSGTYKLHFETAEYWQGQGQTSFYPFVEVWSVGRLGQVTHEVWGLGPGSRGCTPQGLTRGGDSHCCLLTLPQVVFVITDPAQKLHVPLLISPYSYTTYRGS